VGWRLQLHLAIDFQKLVPSPPCGMATCPLWGIWQVPSPPCGMATYLCLRYLIVSSYEFQAHRVGWRLTLVPTPRSPSNPELVPSPPCGMATQCLLNMLWLTSEPTVWDGDTSFHPVYKSSSKPTVWDGDCCICFLFKLAKDKVPSPPCGMATHLTRNASYEYKHKFQAHRVGCFFSLKFLKTKRKGFNILKAWKTGG
jgi:hypothetical protein